MELNEHNKTQRREAIERLAVKVRTRWVRRSASLLLNHRVHVRNLQAATEFRIAHNRREADITLDQLRREYEDLGGDWAKVQGDLVEPDFDTTDEMLEFYRENG